MKRERTGARPLAVYRLGGTFDKSNLHRPMLSSYWIDNGLWALSLRWGHPGCDPVWEYEIVLATRRWKGAR